MPKRNFIKLSELARKSLNIGQSKKITEAFLEKKCEKIMDEAERTSGPENLRIINIKESDIDILKDYLNSFLTQIIVNGKRKIFDEDYIYLLENHANENYCIDIPFNVLNRLKEYEILKKMKLKLNISQDEFDTLSEEQFKKIGNTYNFVEYSFEITNISKLNIKRLTNIENLNIYYKNNLFKERDLQTVEEIKNKVIDLTRGIEPNQSQIDTFMNIYKKLINYMKYDYTANNLLEKMKKEPLTEDEKQKCYDSQNLYGLISKTTICGGDSTILQCVLDTVGIKNKIIIGGTNSIRDRDHSWNQVCINGKWYNTDITWDRDCLEKNSRDNYCLKSDKDFKKHEVFLGDYETCKESYNEEYIKKCLKQKTEKNVKPWELKYFTKTKQGIVYKDFKQEKTEIER